MEGFLCPSTSVDNATRVIGVVQRAEEHDGARVAYAAGPVPFTEDLRLLTAPLDAAEVLRLAGPCAEQRCAHHVDGRCSLGERAVSLLPPVVQRAPRCSIRSHCRWYGEQGLAVCQRCPAIVTSTTPADDRMRVAATPPPGGATT
jgi:hypothetical protein